MKEKMIDTINEALMKAKNEFTGEWTNTHELKMMRIYGMLDMLCLYTGENYKITTNGTIEKI